MTYHSNLFSAGGNLPEKITLTKRLINLGRYLKGL